MRIKYLLVPLLLAVSTGCFSQLNFVFLPEINGRSIDGLSAFQLQNLTGKTLTGNIYIEVKENINKLKVVSVKTQEININPGVSSFPRINFVNSQLQFAANAFANITSQTRSFPPGEYSFCFHFVPSVKGSPDNYEDCFDGSIQPLVPISLLNPSDRDTICNKRPFLTWQPPLPYSAAMRFRLLLTEKKPGTAPVENLLMNVPLVFLDNITSTSVNYPATSPELKEGKTYCWQVIAFMQGVVLSKSEIWEFTVQCKEQLPLKPNDSYRELKSLVNGNYYVTNKYLKFSFTNNYNVSKLSYGIYDLANAQKQIKRTPEVTMQPGLNKIDIDVTDLELEPGKQYLLKVFPFNEPVIEVRFVYQENDVLDK